MAENTGIQRIKSFLEKDELKKRFEEVLKKDPASFISSALAVISQSYQLQNVEPSSLFTALMQAATLKLPIGLDQAYIVPYKGKAQFQLGYKGLKQLAIRSGQFKVLIDKVVYEGQMEPDTSFLGYKFNWANVQSTKIIGYASYFELNTGYKSTKFMSVEDVQAHASRYSQSYRSEKSKSSSLWSTDFDKMALKTVVKLHLGSGEAPLSIEMQSAIKADQAIIGDDGSLTYPDNQTKGTKQIQQEAERERLEKAIEFTDNLSEFIEIYDAIEDRELEEKYSNKFSELLQNSDSKDDVKAAFQVAMDLGLVDLYNVVEENLR